jgi:hypothetical protein
MTNPAFLVKGLPSPALACAAYAAGAVFAPSPWRWVLLWPAIVYLLITYCYAIDGSAGAQLLRKRAATDGSLPLPCLLFFLPFLLTSWFVWWFRHTCVHRAEQPFNEITPGIFLGRYPSPQLDKTSCWPGAFPVTCAASEIPEPACGVVDMCCEFPAHASIVAQAKGLYRCMPCLDGDMPADEEAFVTMCQEVAGWDASHSVYVHCANGRGRSACVVVMLLVLRGHAEVTPKPMRFHCCRLCSCFPRLYLQFISGCLQLDSVIKPVLCSESHTIMHIIRSARRVPYLPATDCRTDDPHILAI